MFPIQNSFFEFKKGKILHLFIIGLAWYFQFCLFVSSKTWKGEGVWGYNKRSQKCHLCQVKQSQNSWELLPREQEPFMLHVTLCWHFYDPPPWPLPQSPIDIFKNNLIIFGLLLSATFVVKNISWVFCYLTKNYLNSERATGLKARLHIRFLHAFTA